jgi:histidyl-tRNA synthetase
LTATKAPKNWRSEALVRRCGYSESRIKIDPSVVRGLEYYTGPVYECELLFDVTNEKGETVQFGSVGRWRAL